MAHVRTCDICGKGIRQQYGFTVLLIGRDGKTFYTGNDLEPKDRVPMDFCVPCFDVFAGQDWQRLADLKRAPGVVMEADEP